MIRLLKKSAKRALLHCHPRPGDGIFAKRRYLFFNFVICLRPVAVRNVMVTHYKKFEKGLIMRELLDSILGRSLFTLDGREWKNRRSLFNQWYGDVIVRELLADFKLRLEKEITAIKPGEDVNIAAFNRRVVTASFGEAFLGAPASLVQALNDYQRTKNIIFVRAWLRLLRIYGFKNLLFIKQVRYLHHEVRRMLQDVTSYSKEDNRYIPFLRERMERGEVSLEEVQTEIMSSFSSSLTTSFSLTMLSMHLAEHPEILEDLDIDDALAESICMESTRITPTTYVLFRQALEEISIENCPIKKGQHIIVPIETVQRDEKNWVDAQKFCPHRFVGQTRAELSDSPWFSFGAGPRQCPGKGLALEMMKIYLQTIKGHGVIFHPGKKWPPEFDRGLVLEPKNNEMWVRTATR